MPMITVSVPEGKPVSQKNYDNVVNSLQLHMLTCSCGHSGCLIHHGTYQRSVITPDGKVKLSIVRVKCTECGHTHALLLSSIVPYSQISLTDHVLIIQCYESGNCKNELFESNIFLDENNTKSLHRRYLKFWKQRILSESILLAPLEQLICKCFDAFRRQFMQIRCTFNALFI